jgi:hypothetical protein
MGEPVIEQAHTPHVKEWWEGDGRGEHLVDVALPHEDQEDVGDVPALPEWAAGLVAVLCVLACFGAVTSVIVAFVLDVL